MRYADGGGLSPERRAEREAVRMDAAEMFERGATPAEVAEELRVTEKSAYAWRRAWQAGGAAALASKGPGGMRCQLDDRQLARLEAELRRGPAAHGWDDQRWTLARIAEVIKRKFGVSYTLAGVSALLRRRGWSVQQPVHKPVERDEEEIRRWKEEVWPRILAEADGNAETETDGNADAETETDGETDGNADAETETDGETDGNADADAETETAWICFEDEAGQSTRPPKARTWARRGQTPVIPVSGRGSGKVSIAGMVCVKRGEEPRLIYLTRKHTYRKGERRSLSEDDYAKLITKAHEELGAPLILIWDNLNTHTSTEMRAFLDANADWLTVHRLPAYAPDINPAEGVWANLKSRTRNLAAAGLGQLAKAVEAGMRRIQGQPALLAGFVAETGLALAPL